jgi:DNA repair exonuclease SbcCD ATPase subunit
VGPEGHLSLEESPSAPGAPGDFGSLITALTGVAESERCRLLAELFSEIAQSCRDGSGSGRAGTPAQQLTALSRRIQELEKDHADLEDRLRTTAAELAHRQKQAEAEKARGEELQAVCTSQRARLESMEAEVKKLEAEVVNRSNDLHRAQAEKESLELKLQRVEIASNDTSRAEALEEEKRQLTAQIKTLQAAAEQLRTEKNEEIERLEADLARSQSRSSQSADALLASLWQRLSGAKPALVTEPHVPPSVQAAERLVDAFIELAGFVHKFDQDMRPNLDGFTRPNEELRRLWNVYKEQRDLYETIRQTIAPAQGKHVGALKMQLRVCRNWAFAALVSCDSTIEWIADELRAQLLDPEGAGSNPRCTLKDYVKMSGPEAFLERMRRLRGQKLAEVYGRGG